MTSFSPNRRFLALAGAAFLFCGCAAEGKNALSAAAPGTAAGPPIAFLPIENLSGSAVPMKEMRAAFAGRLGESGVPLLDDGTLDAFLSRHRVRYTGGLSVELGKALRDETGARAALISSVDLYDKAYPPKVAVTSRLVSTGENAVILWMDAVSLAGDDSPGLLGLGLVREPAGVRDRVIGQVADSLAARLARDRGGTTDTGERGRSRIPRDGRFRPKAFFRYRGAPPEAGRGRKVAVLPFANDSTRKNAGEVVRLQVLRELVALGNVEVIDPGEVRSALLNSRTILEGGVSLPQGDLLREMLDVELLVSGTVKDFEDTLGPWGAPYVNFSCQLLDTREHRVLWSSISYNRGNDGVFFFDWGRVGTAHAMASEMSRKIVAQMIAAH